MKIVLQISVEGNRGSIGRFAENLGTFIINNNWESHIAFGRYPRKSESRLYRIGSGIETFLHVIETRITGSTGLGSRLATKRLIKYIKQLKPDIIHLHHLHGYYINYVILFCYLKESNIPVVWTFHDCWSFTGNCPYFEIAKCDKWKTLCDNCPQIHKYPRSIYFDSSTKNYLLKRRVFNDLESIVIVSVSKWLEGKIYQSFLKQHKIFTIYNGVDLTIFSKEIHGSRQFFDDLNIATKFVILGVANIWEERKGLDDFIHFAKFLNEDEIILLVGLQAHQMKLLPRNIIAIERTENLDDLAFVYNKADVFLNLSSEETFGLTTVEALASGTPIIVYNSSANPEIVNDSTGFIIEIGDFNGLRRGIDIIKQNTKQFYFDNCKKRARECYDQNICYTNYFNLYKSLIP
jgi:glycosyltransferase involved in cell wall biosynthesis